MSGKVWTDYNAHDPGVTLADIANHALTELDYKLGFPVTDFLTEQGRPFSAARFGLFPPETACTFSPVTEEDYRSMLLAEVSGLANVRVRCNPETGAYTIIVMPLPFTEDNGRTAKYIAAAFNSRRNLCEWLEKVEIAQADPLKFEAEFDIADGENATEVLAQVYHTMLYAILSGQETTEHGLYRRLCGVSGVTRFRTCYLKEGEDIQTRFHENAGVYIPERQDELVSTIHIYLGNTEQNVDIDRFRERLKTLCLADAGNSARIGERMTEKWRVPESAWHNIFAHYPIACDFPACYRLTPDAEIPSPFEAYTRLYDRVIKYGLEELKALPHLLSIDVEDEDFPHNRRTLRLKSRYLDFLDALYGAESHPAWFAEENSYGETEEETLHRRANFLRNIARMVGERARARDVTRHNSNAPVVKEYFCLLLGIDPDDGHTVSNVLPGHNLRLLERRKVRHGIMNGEKNCETDSENAIGIADRMDSLLISERMLRPENVGHVPFVELSGDKAEKLKEYAEMRAALPFFNENLITGDLFRGGTDLNNYRTVRMEDGAYMLLYRHKESSGWTNLGRDTGRERLERLANILRRYLRELNRRCETLYIVEQILADTSCPFEVTLVLPSWTYRFHNPRFREKCRELLRTLIPTHITGKLCWLGEKEMQRFELCYHHLMHTFTDRRLSGYRKDLLETINRLTGRAEDIQELNDTY